MNARAPEGRQLDRQRRPPQGPRTGPGAVFGVRVVLATLPRGRRLVQCACGDLAVIATRDLRYTVACYACARAPGGVWTPKGMMGAVQQRWFLSALRCMLGLEKELDE